MSAEAALCFLGYCTDANPSIQEDGKTKCANRSSLPVVLPSSVLRLGGWTQTARVLVLLLTGKARESSQNRNRRCPDPAPCWWEDTAPAPSESNCSVLCGCNEGSRCKDGWALQPVCWDKKVGVQLSHKWRGCWGGGDLWVSWRMCHLDPAGYLEKQCGR